MGYELWNYEKTQTVYCIGMYDLDLNKSKRTKITGRPHKEAVNFDEI